MSITLDDNVYVSMIVSKSILCLKGVQSWILSSSFFDCQIYSVATIYG